MNRREFVQNASLLLASAKWIRLEAQNPSFADSKQWLREFANPPAGTYPWVYSFWLEGNVTKEGITADLEGMKEAGIEGLLFMDGAIGNPVGPLRFMSEPWLDTFQYMLSEAGRLGLEVNLNNDPGWAGSGGPWITPEIASQQAILGHTVVQGPLRFEAILEKPAGIRHSYYKDIAVIAYPAPSDGAMPAYRIPDYDSTKSFSGGQDFFEVVPWPRFIPTNPDWPAVPATQSIHAAGMQDLTDKFDREGKLIWDVPPGRWIIFRLGHTVGNGATRSVQKEASGLECDKLSKAALDIHFAHMVGKLSELAGPLLGKVLVSTHIDSWEAGSGNWTEGFREQFRRRRGYDLLPFSPALGGIVVDSREVSERFLWDYRETVCELMLENYAGHMRELAHSKGLRLSIEAYDGTCDDLRYAGRADEPMTEFWRSCYSGLPLSDLSESMTSAAHVYGKPIVGAEAFTSGRGDFLDHPATLKPMADWAFCTGVSRLSFSEWIMQPWKNLIPGISFAIFGTVFHRTLTWWEQAKPWHEYIARCQYMLRQGRFAADVCFVAPEGGPYRFTPPIPATVRGVVPDRPPYNFDGCPAELVLKGMTVEDGFVVLPSGMRYRLLVLPTYNANGQNVVRLMDQKDYFYKAESMPNVETMTPELLARIQELVESGATVLGHRPRKSPSLANFPECDRQVERLADAIWGKGGGASGTGERLVGKGRVIWGRSPEEVFAHSQVPPDFESEPSLKGKLNYTHRRGDDGVDIYFVVNQQAALLDGVCNFRVSGRRPELWWPQSGRVVPISAYEEGDGVTMVRLSLEANEAVFVVFREPAVAAERISAISKDGERLWPARKGPTPAAVDMDGSFALAAWVRPGPALELPEEVEGGWAYKNKMKTPGRGYETFSSSGQGRGGFSIGTNGIVVYEFGESGAVEPLLVHAAPMAGFALVGVIYRDRIPKLYINGELVKVGPRSRFAPWGKCGWADKRFFAGEVASLAQFEETLVSKGIDPPAPSAIAQLPALDLSHGRAWKTGAYGIEYAGGRSRKISVKIPPPEVLTGSWQVEFDPKWGGPKSITFEKLLDWREHSDEGIRYYSGTAIYRKTFRAKGPSAGAKNLSFHLDLGTVAVTAEVIFNGKNVGIVWNSPYRMDITEALRDGENTLEIRVANLWVNRLIGDEQLPTDCTRDAKGQVEVWPQWILAGEKSPTGRYTFTSRRQWDKIDPLVQSGLIGPVQIIASVEIT